MKSKQRGFTLMELLVSLGVVVWFLFCIALVVGLVYVGWHFIAKVW
jgi:prepilin-type N-terminal cleavage/methylation domain-containing protein